MPTPVITPISKTLYLCDGTIGLPGGKTDLMGLFNSVHAPRFPHVAKDFVVFAQLSQGLGKVPFYIDLRFASTNQLMYTSNVHQLLFPRRDITVQLAYTVASFRFPQSGLYLVELFCNNQWVADTTLLLGSGVTQVPRNRKNHTNRFERQETAFIGELQRFTDPPGGATLDDPEVRARKRRGRPRGRRHAAPSGDQETLPVK